MKKNQIRNNLRKFIFSLIKEDIKKLIEEIYYESILKLGNVENKVYEPLISLPMEFYSNEEESNVININRNKKAKDLLKLIKNHFEIENKKPDPPKSVA